MAGTSSGTDAAGYLTGSGALFDPAWLPPGGRGNGLRAPSWAPIADLDADDVDSVLAALLDARIPAHAAPAPRPVRPLTSHRSVPRSVWRLRVAASSYSRAEDVLLRVLRGSKTERVVL
ncbi:hypothetical protein ACF1BS_24575 [Streptomyces sp. NPDC014748]|uniref:hypothetical protein n=1 Tax=unclassified Streptomyces TaxID=2593676 RepID=UPI00146EF091|nr:hypothetical protein [Streptomyces sp. GMY02]NMO33447.1 hypothetical protein [Streptomyces sp. GMY02]